MTVLVTGGSGLVGGAIIDELLKNNYEVCALINEKSVIGKKCSVVKADIRDLSILKNLPIPGKINAVIHCAGLAHQFTRREEKDFWEINVEGTKNISELAAAKSAEQFILISSVSVYGKSDGREKGSGEKNLSAAQGLDETAECRPDGIYARSKLESETAARQVCDHQKMNLVILRLATVVGENERGNVFRLIKTIDQGKFRWIGNGGNLKSLIYKGDVARACLKVLGRNDAPGIYNVTADALPMKEIVEQIHRRLGRANPRFSISPVILNGLFALNRRTFNIKKLDATAETVRKWLADDIFAGEKFNRRYRFRIETPISEAIAREVASYLKSK